jgi:cyclic-di-AMP phosphodiesterase PgpH
VVCVGWLRSTQPGAYARARRKWLMILLGLLAMAIAASYRYLAVGLNWIPSWLVPFLIPITLATMLAMLLLGPSSALAMGMWSSLSAALIFDRSFELLLLGLGGSVLAVVLLQNVRKRSQVMRAGFAVGLLAGVMALALAARYQHLPGTFLMQVAGGVSSGVLAAILTTLLLPFVEWLFQHTTAISLLELTDMSHPLLQRLALEAPGTYHHHSLMTGAIGQAAANRIGADGLQVAVCAYFHDIGKLAKPEFFIENQRSGENPHDSLAPSMSALVIQSHVKEGLTLAKRYKLPGPVCDGIRTHHGTALTSYFYQVARRALKEAGLAEDASLEHAYRYDGPKPATREGAVLMLADTVEAASRSLEKAMPNRIAEMVDTLLRDKLLDGQLDRCPLTLEDLHEIRASFVFSLTNILHGRNPYPREDPLAQPAKSAARTSRGVPAAGPDAVGPGVPG